MNIAIFEPILKEMATGCTFDSKLDTVAGQVESTHHEKDLVALLFVFRPSRKHILDILTNIDHTRMAASRQDNQSLGAHSGDQVSLVYDLRLGHPFSLGFRPAHMVWDSSLVAGQARDDARDTKKPFADCVRLAMQSNLGGGVFFYRTSIRD